MTTHESRNGKVRFMLRQQYIIVKISAHSLTIKKKINEAAGDIAIQDPSMLTQKKGKLLEAAKDEVYACGYNFKKGHSRSKRFSSDSSSSSTPKRKNLNKEFREDRIHNIKEEIHDLNSRICFKEKRVLAAANMKNYKICDEVSGEISELKTKRRELETELKELQRKDNRAQKYQMKRSKNRSSNPPSQDISSDEVFF